MDAVLPLTARDVPRARVLFHSLVGRFQGLGTVWVVGPDRDRPALVEECTRWPLRFEVLAESALVPEFRLTPWLSGWYRQQLIKLAISSRVQSGLYLTLDADVVCTKAVSPELIAPRGRGPCHTVQRDLHPQWYRDSEAVLGLAARRRGISHNVTPAVLHREAVAELARYVDERARSGRFAAGLRGLKQRAALALARSASGIVPWRLALAVGAPWTEYALYYTFLEATHRFERFHEHVEVGLYDAEGSFWRADRRDFATWSPDVARNGTGAPWFVVVQSNSGVRVEAVEAKFRGEFSNA